MTNTTILKFMNVHWLATSSLWWFTGAVMRSARVFHYKRHARYQNQTQLDCWTASNYPTSQPTGLLDSWQPPTTHVTAPNVQGGCCPSDSGQCLSLLMYITPSWMHFGTSRVNTTKTSLTVALTFWLANHADVQSMVSMSARDTHTMTNFGGMIIPGICRYCGCSDLLSYSNACNSQLLFERLQKITTMVTTACQEQWI